MPPADVLVVDDSMSARFALTRSLQPHGFNIETAKTAEEAIEIAAKSRYDIIFMDHVLPGMNGLEATEEIRKIPEHAQTPIIMCSSNEGDDYVQDALNRGATAVITKPPQEAALNAVIEKYLSGSANETQDSPALNPTVSADRATVETASMSDSDQLAQLDARLDRLEAMLERLEKTVGEMDQRTAAIAKSVASRAGQELANRLLRAVISLKGPGK